MLKEVFEQPINSGNESEMSQEERDGLIEEKEVWLQGFMDLALEKLNSDFEKGLINEDIEKKRFESLLQTNEEIASADEKSKNIHETLSRLDEIGSRFERLLGIKEEVEALKKKYGDAWIRAGIEAAKEKKMDVEIELPRDKTFDGKNTGHKNRFIKVKIGGGLYGRRTKPGQKDHERSPMPPTL